MRVNEWLSQVSKELKTAGIATARLDCLVLLEDETGKDRTYLLAHPETIAKGSTFRKLKEQVDRRAKHEPLAYIRGKTEFYGRELIINKNVLEPRPESETMIELALKVMGYRFQVSDNIRVIDVGTGSGALAITIKLEIPKVEVIATDIDPKCLAVARLNAQKHSVNVKFYQGNLLDPLYNLKPETYNIIMANLPYVPDKYVINNAAANEPRIAIFGGPDGLDLYRQLFSQLSKNKRFTGVKYVLTESLPPQHNALAKIAKNHGYKQHQEDDFIQAFARL